jgi:hypothetical protein
MNRRLSCVRRVSGLVATMLLAIILGIGATPMALAAGAGAQREVTVVRDMTKESRCELLLNGIAVGCPEGAVLGDFRVPEDKAIANGEAYAIPEGDPAKYQAEVRRLIAEKRKEITAKRRQSDAELVTARGTCGAYNTYESTFTAYNFGSPQPTIKHQANFYITPSCANVEFSWAKTMFQVSGSNAYLLNHIYDGFYFVDDDCRDIPSYTLLGNVAFPAGYDFVTSVRNSCSPFYSTAYGSFLVAP